jgi:hypothetical protein
MTKQRDERVKKVLRFVGADTAQESGNFAGTFASRNRDAGGGARWRSEVYIILGKLKVHVRVPRARGA